MAVDGVVAALVARLYAHFIVKSCFHETSMKRRTAFHQQVLHSTLIQICEDFFQSFCMIYQKTLRQFLRKTVMTVNRNAKRLLPTKRPVAHSERRMVGQNGVCTHENCLTTRPQSMDEHLSERSGNLSVNTSVGSLCPLQRHKRTMLAVKCHEDAIDLPAFLLQNSDNHLATCVFQFLYPQPVHFGERVSATDHHPGDSLFNDEICTRRCFTPMCTRFKCYVNRTLPKKRLVGKRHTSHGIHLSMRSAATAMIAFPDDSPVVYDNSSHHGIRSCRSFSAKSQLQGSAHIDYVFL